jgi:hypothetical protein
MKPVLPLRFLLPAGLFILSAGLMLRHFASLPDFANGILMGVGIGILVLSLIYTVKGKQAL